VAQTARYTNRNSDGNLYVRYLNWRGDRWNWNCNWLDSDWNGSNPAVDKTNYSKIPRGIAGDF
jgi:hypothetical protein|tara:strand:+ start:351 stop:539 length:189 start_codon:yes stop_codon:yes gene_type:complete